MPHTLKLCTLFVGSVFCGHASAEEAKTPLQELAEKYADQLLPIDYIEANFLSEDKLVDCQETSVPQGNSTPETRWIYNATYRWVFVPAEPGKSCVFLDQPEHRGLTRDEARLLLSAGNGEPAVPDAASSAKEKADSDQIEKRESFGGTDTEEVGTLNGYSYCIHFRGIGPQFEPLERAQRELAAREKEILTKLPHSKATTEPDSRTVYRRSYMTCGSAPRHWLELRFESGGKTHELVALRAVAVLHTSNDVYDANSTTWILHAPSGRFVSFNDLFVDAGAARSRVSEAMKDYSKSYFSSGDITFMGTAEEERKYKADFARAALAATTPTSEHFKDFSIDTGFPPSRDIRLHFAFPADQPAGIVQGTIDIEKLRDLLKPAYQRAFDIP